MVQRSRNEWWAWATVMVMSFLTGTVQAQSSHHVAWSKVQIGPWTFNPIYAETPQAVPEVVSFLALADSATLTGDNLVAVWYLRDTNGWTTKSWETCNPWDAIKFVKEHFDIADAEDERWDMFATGAATAVAQLPKGYDGGLLTSDPLAELVNAAPNQDELVRFLAADGYQAASVPVDKDADCTLDDKMNGMAREAVGFLTSGDNTIRQLSASGSMCEAFAGVYPAPPEWGPPNVVKPPKPAVAPPWTPNPVTPAAPGWTPNTWSVWDCTATPAAGGGTHCVCRRSRRWGRWETKFGIRWWREFEEREKCEDTGIAIPCPAGGPPATTSPCTAYFP